MEQLAKNGVMNLRALNGAFITNIQGKTAAKRCICIPIEDNFIVEKGYVSNGKEIRTAELAFKQWPVSDESREKYGKKQDYDLRLDIGKAAHENLAQTNPDLAARLRFNDAAYDRELAKQVLPYIGVAYDIKPQNLPPEEVTTITAMPSEGDEDLPY
ncbi:MAG: hypothetical protein IKV77_05140 [Alistipes sp.]|nr:hypothetical protein [Bacteroidales bacterium]MBR5492497.1 hypothetical protein [Alistipes sp.]MBR5920052.1 hypothetical protein [Bacteroidales bacterium]